MRTLGSLLRKNSPVLRTGRSRVSPLRPLRRRYAATPEKPLPSPRRNREIEDEIRKIEGLITGIGVSLKRTEERIDLHLGGIGQTLQELAELKEKIRTLERELGIERPGA